MSNRDQSASPPAAGSITVATGPAPPSPSPRGQQPDPAPDADAESSITAAAAPPALAPAPAAGPEGELTSAAAGEKDSQGRSDAQSVAAAATAVAAAAAGGTDAITTTTATAVAAVEVEPSGTGSGVQGETGQLDDGDAMDGVESTGGGVPATPATTTTAPTSAAAAAAVPSKADEKRPITTTTEPTAQPALRTTTAENTAAPGGPSSLSSKQKDGVTRGAFVVFEGLDRAGKTTQAKLLQQRCIESGRDVVYMRFPDRTTPIGQMIDAYLRGETETEDHVIHLLFSANRWEAINKIKSLLASGKTIICDRYYHSGIVYSAAKHLASLPLSWARAPEVGLPRPDVVLFLDLDEEVARSRGGWGGEVYERGEMQRRVRELFWGLSMGDLGKAATGTGAAGKKAGVAEKETNVSGVSYGGAATTGGGGALVNNPFRQEEEDIQIVDANLGVEELSDKVWDIVMARVEAVERGEVGKTVRTVQ